MNKVVLIGRLTKDPEVRYSNSDTPIAIVRYTLAVRRSRNRSSESDADFINIVAFGKNGEFAEKYFAKGNMISIAGRIHQNVWEDAEHVKHSNLEVIAEEQQSIGSKPVSGYNMIESTSDNEVAASDIWEDE